MADIEILASDGHGIYLPQHVARSYGAELFPERNNPKNADELKECIDILMSGPTNNEYWEAWEWVLDNACIKVNRSRWTLYQLSRWRLLGYSNEQKRSPRGRKIVYWE